MSEITHTSRLQEPDDELAFAQDTREVMVDIDHVSMEFNMASEKLNSLKEYAIAIARRKLFFESFTALDDITFQIKKGDVFGILGTNGSGKSTLLKIIAGVLDPSQGHVQVNGNVAPLIELGAGFDMELSARENIYLNGALLGYSKQFINEHFEDIVEFAEIRDFLEMPMKNYSSGMVARIAFAIATIIVPEILIVDEVLSVGDFMFQQKCEDRINELITQHGVTVLFVSHSNDQIERLCNKAVWIEKGHLRMIGTSAQVCNAYRVLGGRTGSKQSEERVFSALQQAQDAACAPVPSTVVGGDNQFLLATKAAWEGWHGQSMNNIVLVPDNAHVFSIASAGIAGALDAPIVPIKEDEVPGPVLQLIEAHQSARVIAMLPAAACEALAQDEEFLSVCRELVCIPCEEGCIGIRRAMLKYGLENGTWQGSSALLGHFSEPLPCFAAAPLAYARMAPFIITDTSRTCLEDDVLDALRSAGIDTLLAIGSIGQSPIAEHARSAGFTVVSVGDAQPGDECMAVARYLRDAMPGGASACVSSGMDAHWQDLIAAPSYAGKLDAPLLLVDTTSLDSVAGSLDLLGDMGARELSFIGTRGISPQERDLLARACR